MKGKLIKGMGPGANALSAEAQTLKSRHCHSVSIRRKTTWYTFDVLDN